MYSTSHKGYKCLSSDGWLYIYRCLVQCVQNSRFTYPHLFPPSSPISGPTPSSLPLVLIPTISPNPSQSLLNSAPSPPQPETSSHTTIVPQADSTSPPPSRPTNIYLMVIRSKAGIFKARIHPTLLLTHVEPKSVKQALQDP